MTSGESGFSSSFVAVDEQRLSTDLPAKVLWHIIHAPTSCTAEVSRRANEDPSFLFRWPAIADTDRVLGAFEPLEGEMDASEHTWNGEANGDHEDQGSILFISELIGKDLDHLHMQGEGLRIVWERDYADRQTATIGIRSWQPDFLTSTVFRKLFDHTFKSQSPYDTGHLAEDFTGIIKQKFAEVCEVILFEPES